MPHTDSIRMLREGVQTANPAEWRRIQARVAWVRETVAKLRAAQRKADQAWDRIFAALPAELREEELEAMHLPDPPEQAEVDALYAQLRAVIDQDRWPKHLHFGCL